MQMTSQLDTEIAKAVEDIYAPDTDDRQRVPGELTIQSNHFHKLVDEIGRDICAPSQPNMQNPIENIWLIFCSIYQEA